jgi:predicted site-specific integrase-resolvase
VEIEIINHRDEQKYEEEITEDIIAIMTSYSARIYGKRGGKKKCKK